MTRSDLFAHERKHLAHQLRRYPVGIDNSNLVDKWLRDNRHAPTPDADVAELEVSTSLLVEIKSVVSSPTS